MTTTEAILHGDDRNFTIKVGPQHLASCGEYELPGDEKAEEA